MSLSKKIVQYSVMAFALSAFSFISYGIYAFLDNKREQREKWSQISHEFKSCNLFYALRKMGYSDSPLADSYAYVSLPDAYAQLREPLVDLLTAGVGDGRITGLDQVWLDPNSVGAIGTSRMSETSLNFYDQCKESIDQGRLKQWLEVGIYYLIVGDKERAIEWLESAGKNNIPDALVLLGHAYKNGLLTGLRDHRAAIKYYRRAADMDSIKGKFYYAQMIEEQNPASAIAFLESAAAQGSLSSAYRLAAFFPPRMESRTYGSEDRYFWALVFQGLNKYWLSKPFSQRLDHLTNSPNLKEGSLEYPLDGIPSLPWTEYRSRFTEADTVLRYKTDGLDSFVSSSENSLTPPQRVEVQDRVREWLRDFRERAGTSK